jgi:hypothetical protein
MVRSVFHLNSGLLNGLSGFIAPATSVVIGLAIARLDPRRAMTIGIYAAIVGATGIIGGVFAGSLAIMITGAVHRRCRLRRMPHRIPAPHLPARAGAINARGS